MTNYKNWKRAANSYGTIESIAVQEANGFRAAISESTGPDTVINLETTVLGLVKGDGTSLSPALSAIVGNLVRVATGGNLIEDANVAITTDASSNDDTHVATTRAMKSAIAAAVTSNKVFQGGYDASTNLFPATRTLGGVPQAGDNWEILVGGNPGGVPVYPNDTIVSLVDNPGQTASNWAVNSSVSKEYVDAQLALKADAAATTASLALKADTITVNAALALKADAAATTASLALKADTTTVNAALALKADVTYVDAGLSTKADAAATTASLALKADTTTVNAALALKADAAATTASLALKADTTTVNAALALKADVTYVDAGLSTKADAAATTTSLALKANLSGGATFSGNILVPNQTQGDSSQKASNTAYVDAGLATKEPTITNLPANRGGTGLTSYAIGDLLYASTTTALARLAAAAAAGYVLTHNGPGLAPAWTNAPSFSGNPTAPNIAAGDASTKLVNSNFVNAVARSYSNAASSGNINLTSDLILTTQSADGSIMRLPDASTTLPNAIYTIYLIGAAQNATITVPTGQYLNNTLNGTVSIVSTPSAVVSFRSNGANYWVQIDDVAALASKANLAGGATFTGNIIVPDQSSGDNSSKAANTKYTDSSLLTFNNINGLKLSWASSTTLGLTSGYWNVLGSSIMRTSPSLTINIANSGVVNGLDTGTAANSTNYYVYVIAHGTNPALNGAILSINSSAPTLPSGYTVSRYIGRVRRDGSGVFVPFLQTGNGSLRNTNYNGATSTTQVLSGGGASTFTALSLANFVPPGCRKGVLRFDKATTVVGSYFANRETGSSVVNTSSIKSICTGGVTDSMKLSLAFLCNTSQSIDYMNSGGGDLCNVYVESYEEEL